MASRAPVKVVEVVSRHHDEVQEEQEQRLIQRDQARAPEWGGGHGGRGGRWRSTLNAVGKVEEF